MSGPLRGIFYGWWIVAASFLILLVTVGVGLYAPPVFLVPLQDHFGWSRAAIAVGGSIAAITVGAVSPFVGALIDRYGARKVMAGGALLMGGAFASMGMIRSLWHLYLLNIVGAAGISCVAWLPNQTLVSNWFDRKRGRAMGIANAGIGFGGFTMAFLAGILVTQFGWQTAFTSLGGLVLLLVLTAVLLVVRTRPADLGLLPDGDSPDSRRLLADGSGEPPEAGGLSLPEAFRTSAFWVLSLGQIFWSFGSMSIIAHLAACLSDRGFETRIAAGSLGVTILVSVVGRVSFGFFSDRYQKRLIMSAALALHALAVACLFLEHSIAALATFIIVFGMGLGGGSVVVPLLVGEYFGLRAFGTILGLVTISGTLGAALGPVATGRIFDVTGSYDLAFVLHIASFCAAAVAMLLLRRPGRAVAPGDSLS